MPPLPSTPGPADHAAADERFAREDQGYHHDLHNRQMQMIAIGGAIGTGCSWARADDSHPRAPGCS
jgi:L-asparagine permease